MGHAAGRCGGIRLGNSLNSNLPCVAAETAVDFIQRSPVESIFFSSFPDGCSGCALLHFQAVFNVSADDVVAGEDVGVAGLGWEEEGGCGVGHDLHRAPEALPNFLGYVQHARRC